METKIGFATARTKTTGACQASRPRTDPAAPRPRPRPSATDHAICPKKVMTR